MKRAICGALLVCIFQLAAYCPFCDPKVWDKQKYTENEYAVALYDIKPLFLGHCLIVTKRHIERYSDMTKEEAAAVLELIQKTDVAVRKSFHSNSYFLMQRSGKEVGQSVFHMHVHYIPNFANSSPIWFYFRLYFCDPFSREIHPEELNKILESLRKNVPSPSN